MAESLEKAVVRNLQKEQERERRRIRDRERRQSMTAEEREKHLARRRKNYQLRRQRAADVNTNSNLLAAATRTSMLVLPSHQPIISIQNDSTLHRGGLPKECSYTAQEKSTGLEVPPLVSSKLPQRSRLNYIKLLARSVNYPVDVDCMAPVQVASGLLTEEEEEEEEEEEVEEEEEEATPSGLQQNGLRLNHVKQLARAISTDMTRTTSLHLSNERQGQPYKA